MTRALILSLALLAAVSSHAADTTRLVADAPSRLVLEGSSNVTDWRCQGTTLDGRMEVAAPLSHINSVIDHVEDGDIAAWMSNPAAGRFPTPTFQLKVPVQSLRCGNGRMERDMYRALRASSFPTIEFRFEDLVGAIRHDIDAGSYRARVSGVLSLAGQKRTINIDIEARRVSRDRFRLRATLPLRMTDFNITPPTALFGAIKASNDLVVRFDLTLDATGATHS